MGESWQETVLWQKLLTMESPDAVAARAMLGQCMSTIEIVLAKGGTAPTDFTLHDAGHGFRVAQRMAQIVPSDVLSSLTGYELALLLLSGYLHDIGMTPEQRRVALHYSYLLTGDRQDLEEPEVEKFQEWLDDHAGGLLPPMAQGPLTVEVLRQASYLITHYARHRHNDWSEEWIRKHLSAYQMGTFAGWLGDLIALCRSHH